MKAKFIISGDQRWLEVNGEKITNIGISSFDGAFYEYPKMFNGKVYEDPRPYVGKLTFNGEVLGVRQEDVEECLTAIQIACQIEHSTLDIFRKGQKPTKVYLPKGYWEILINFYGKPFVSYETVYEFNGGMRFKNQWRGLEMLDSVDDKIKVE